VALGHGEVDIARESLLGRILMHLALIMGISFLAGERYHGEQPYDKGLAHTSSALLLLAVIIFAVPTGFRTVAPALYKLSTFFIL